MTKKAEQQVTPLHIAAHAGHLDMVRLLLSVAADLNQTTPNRGTAAEVDEADGGVVSSFSSKDATVEAIARLEAISKERFLVKLFPFSHYPRCYAAPRGSSGGSLRRGRAPAAAAGGPSPGHGHGVHRVTRGRAEGPRRLALLLGARALLEVTRSK